ncbi:hypothetical protein WA158_007859 [Blastocystis sp. Blastoise]
MYLVMAVSDCTSEPVSACTGGTVSVKIDMTMHHSEILELYRGSENEKVFQYSFRQTGLFNTCLSRQLYTISASCERSSGDIQNCTDRRSFFSLNIEGITVLKDSLDSCESREWTFLPYLPLIKESKWKQSFQVQNTLDWTYSNYNDNTWNEYIYNEYDNESRQGRRYYRTVIDLKTYSTKFTLFDLNTNIQFGTVIYFNGIEVVRYNMNETEIITSSSLATNMEPQAVIERITGNLQYYLQNSTKLTIAIGIFPYHFNDDLKDSFYSILFLHYGNDIYRSGGTASATTFNQPREDMHCLFDHNPNTKWLGVTTGVIQNIVNYTFPARHREWINKYTLVSANDHIERSPKILHIYGSNDNGNTWILLDRNRNITFNGYFEPQTFYMLSNIKAYNKYQFVFIDTQQPNCPNVQLADIVLYSSNIPTITSFQYEKDSYLWYTNKKIHIKPISSGYISYSLLSSSSMPSGLTFDTLSGEIYGETTQSSNNILSISARNILNEIEYTTLNITIITCDLTTHSSLTFSFSSHSSIPSNEIYELQTKDGDIIHSSYGKKNDNNNIETIAICVEDNDYYIILRNLIETEWSSTSLLTIKRKTKGDTSYIIYRDSLKETDYSRALIHIKNEHSFIDTDILCYFSSENIQEFPDITSISDLFYPCFINNTNNNMLTASFSQSLPYHYYISTIETPNDISFHGIEIRIRYYSTITLYINNTYYFSSNQNQDNSDDSNSNNSHTVTLTIDPYLFIPGTTTTLSFYEYFGSSIPQEHTILFSYSSRFLYEVSNHSRTWDMNASLSGLAPINPNDNLYPIIDGLYKNGYNGSFTGNNFSPLNISINYIENRYEFINKYCFINYYNSFNTDPISWNVYGCINNKCNIFMNSPCISWYKSSQTQCFYLNGNHESYNKYIFEIKKIKDMSLSRMSLGEIFLYSVNINNENINPLSYPNPNIEGYRNIELAPNIPDSYYHSFTISPPLPSGISIDPASGSIYGIPEVISQTTIYNVTAYNLRNEIVYTSITIRIQNCFDENTTLLTVEINAGKLPSGQNSFIIYLNDLIKYQESSFSSHFTSIYNYCVEYGHYSLFIKGNSEHGWNGAFLKIYYHHYVALLNKPIQSVNINKYYSLPILYRNIFFANLCYYQINNNNTIVDLSWTTGSLTPEWSHSIIDIDTINSITQYYRYSFNMNRSKNYNVFSYSVAVNTGCIVYINGIEVYRYNLPENNVNSTTFAYSISDTIQYVGGSLSTLVGPVEFYNTSNILAVEIHQESEYMHTHIFSVNGFFVGDNQTISCLFEISSTNNQYSSTQQVTNLFDNDLDTKYYNSETCLNTYIQWTFVYHRKEYINYYIFYSADDCNIRHPSGWILEASHNDGKWTRIHTANNNIFTQPKQGIGYTIANTNSYEMYKFKATECNNTMFSSSQQDDQLCINSFQCSELHLETHSVNNICLTNQGFPAVFENEYSYKPCNQYFTGNQKRFCSHGSFGDIDTSNCILNPPSIFYYSQSNIELILYSEIIPIEPIIDATSLKYTITPSLPNGLLLNKQTGIISGTPSKQIEDTYYNITCQNTSGSKQTSILISISKPEPCSAEDNWVSTPVYNTAYTFCNNTKLYYQSRFCNIKNSKGKWDKINNELCFYESFSGQPSSGYNYYKFTLLITNITNDFTAENLYNIRYLLSSKLEKYYIPSTMFVTDSIYPTFYKNQDSLAISYTILVSSSYTQTISEVMPYYINNNMYKDLYNRDTTFKCRNSDLYLINESIVSNTSILIVIIVVIVIIIIITIILLSYYLYHLFKPRHLLRMHRNNLENLPESHHQSVAKEI